MLSMSKLNEKELYGYLLLNNGFTVDSDLNIIEEKGYFVAVSGIPNIFNVGIMNFELFKSIMNEKRRMVRDNELIGAWIEDNMIYVETSLFVEDLATAINIALANNQIAIYDNETKENIYIIDSIEQSNRYEIVV